VTYRHTLIVTTNDPGYSAHVRNLLAALGQGLETLDASIAVTQTFDSVPPEPQEPQEAPE
jgi:hypothetical protein